MLMIVRLILACFSSLFTLVVSYLTLHSISFVANRIEQIPIPKDHALNFVKPMFSVFASTINSTHVFLFAVLLGMMCLHQSSKR
ncbi:hypothetical protein SAMD00019534_123060, partial [Acytostelium subglobosum LB1]|uniref:hypothetical protein n=1 Tax=Acytostelium subglobosum LB1 TaxID=1410327 RepID=UPI000644A2DB